jgi:transcriptional regulator with XRE-family HTH domain
VGGFVGGLEGTVDEPVTFGRWLRQRRRALDLTQEELARSAGCALDTIKKIETEARRPSRQLAERLANCLDLAPAARPAFVRAARGQLRVGQLARPAETDAIEQPPKPRAGRATPHSTRLLERELYLRAGAELLENAAAGRGALVFLGGEAGIGKTSLIRQLQANVRYAARVLVGACDALSTPRPLGPLVDIASALGREFELLLETETQRPRVFSALLADLHASALPTLLVFEDVHWSDEATLDLLRFLGRRIGDAPAVLIATYREDEVGPRHPLRLVLGDLATAAEVRRFSLPPLSVEAVRALAAGSDIDGRELHRQTGGNPFFVTEVLAAGKSGIPATVRDAVLARAARLTPPALQALEAAAVIGAQVEPQLLGRVAAATAELVEACLATGILAAQQGRLAFRHELSRQAILSSLTPQRSSALHGAVLAALIDQFRGPDELARLAHHAEAAGDGAAVLVYAPAAARRAAALRAHREAAAQYARALRFSDALPPEQRAELLEARSYECYLTDQLAEAIEARQAALAVWRSTGSKLKEGDTLRWISRLQWFCGNRSEAEEAGHAALAVLAALPAGIELAMAYSNQSQLRMLAEDHDEAIAWGERAIALAEQLGDTATLAHALNNVGAARLQSEEERGRAELERSLSLAREADLEEHVARAWTNLSSNAVRHYRLALADSYLAQGLAYCVERDLDSWRLYMLGWQAMSHLAQGRWQAALAAAETVVRHPRVSPVSRIQALVVQGRAQARQGASGAQAALDEALRVAAPTREVQRLAPVRSARAEAAWLGGDMERAAAEARAGLELPNIHRDRWLMNELAYWLWRSGARVQLPATPATPFTTQARGDWRAAAEEWGRLGCPYEVALALADGDEQARSAARDRLRELGALLPPTLTAPGTMREP